MNSPHFNILLADDDKDDCLLFKDALAEIPLSAKLKVVYDGEQLMRLFLTESYTLPDVLFLDLNMPRKNGFDCLKEIKLEPKLRELPVIIFSTSFNRELVTLLQQQGAQHFIRKPAEFCKLKNVIHRTLLLFSRENTFERQSTPFIITDEPIPIHS